MRVQYFFRSDEAYFNAAYDRYGRQHPIRKFVNVIKWLGLIILCACVIVAIIRRVWLPIATLSVFIAIIWFNPQIDRYLRRRKLGRSPYLGQDCTLTFTDAGIESRSAISSSAETWQVFTKAVRFPDGWLMFTGQQFFRWLPDVALAPDSTLSDADDLFRAQIADVRSQS